MQVQMLKRIKERLKLQQKYKNIIIYLQTEEGKKKEKAKQAKADNIAEQQKMKEEAARLEQMAQNIQKKSGGTTSKPVYNLLLILYRNKIQKLQPKWNKK